MTIVALALAGALVLLVSLFGGLLRWQQRTHTRREDILIDQLLHAVGKPWHQAPAAEKPVPEPERERFTASPEQYPSV